MGLKRGRGMIQKIDPIYDPQLTENLLDGTGFTDRV